MSAIFDGGVVRSSSLPPEVRAAIGRFQGAVAHRVMYELAQSYGKTTRQDAQRRLTYLWRHPTPRMPLSEMYGARDWRRAAPRALAEVRRWLGAVYGRIFDSRERIGFIRSLVDFRPRILVQAFRVDGGYELTLQVYRPGGSVMSWSAEAETTVAQSLAAQALLKYARREGEEWRMGYGPLTGVRVIFHHELLATSYRVTPAEANAWILRMSEHPLLRQVMQADVRRFGD